MNQGELKMTDRLIRLMRIITLVQAKPGILARELAERCGNSERTIYRDMDALSAMHIPITIWDTVRDMLLSVILHCTLWIGQKKKQPHFHSCAVL